MHKIQRVYLHSSYIRIIVIIIVPTYYISIGIIRTIFEQTLSLGSIITHNIGNTVRPII